MKGDYSISFIVDVRRTSGPYVEREAVAAAVQDAVVAFYTYVIGDSTYEVLDVVAK